MMKCNIEKINMKCNIEKINEIHQELLMYGHQNSQPKQDKRAFISLPIDWSTINEYGKDMKNAIIKDIKERYSCFNLTILEYDEKSIRKDRLELLKTADIAVFIDGVTNSNKICMNEYNYAYSNGIDIVNVNMSIDIPIEVAE